MDNANPVQPLQNPGDQTQPSVLDRVFGKQDGAAPEAGGNVVYQDDNVIKTELSECINPSCENYGKALTDEGVCGSCGFNQKERY